MSRTSLFVDPVPVHFVADRQTRLRLLQSSMRSGKPAGRLLEDALDALDALKELEGRPIDLVSARVPSGGDTASTGAGGPVSPPADTRASAGPSARSRR
ncbi:MAG: hypothetical protein KGQ66_13115 [Acidobacteriota bacterium]|nr:hypothetical protein [Acidobacteriota bacterium]